MRMQCVRGRTPKMQRFGLRQNVLLVQKSVVRAVGAAEEELLAAGDKYNTLIRNEFAS